MLSLRAILVHGGAWAAPGGEIESHCRGVARAARVGFDTLGRGGSAVDAAVGAVRSMEEDPTFNAGRGSVLNREGEVELDAALMDGQTLSAGAVAAVKGIANPVELARLVMERSPHVLLVGDGALDFARRQGMATCSAQSLIVERERERWERTKVSQGGRTVRESAMTFGPSDTVGAVALDENGHVAGACSTGGTSRKLPGRVGDSPLVGCGLYADDRRGAAVSTGWGEGIIRIVMAERAVELLALGNPAPDAARRTITLLEERTGGRGGIIVMTPAGDLGFAFNTPHMAHAYLADGMKEPVVGV